MEHNRRTEKNLSINSQSKNNLTNHKTRTSNQVKQEIQKRMPIKKGPQRRNISKPPIFFRNHKITSAIFSEGRAAEASKWCAASGQQNENFVDLSGG